jgi:hypothetical protein
LKEKKKQFFLKEFFFFFERSKKKTQTKKTRKMKIQGVAQTDYYIKQLFFLKKRIKNEKPWFLFLIFKINFLLCFYIIL